MLKLHCSHIVSLQNKTTQDCEQDETAICVIRTFGFNEHTVLVDEYELLLLSP